MNDLIPFADLQGMATIFAKTKIFGKSHDEILALMLIAQAEGKHPALAAQEYDIVNGKPALKSTALLSRFQAAGGTIRWIKRTDEECEAEFSHPAGGQLVIKWDKDRATKAGLWGKQGPWQTFKAQMLSSRVVSEGVRAVFPRCLSGMYTDDEVRDISPMEGDIPSEPINVTETGSATIAPEATPEPARPNEFEVRMKAAKALVKTYIASDFNGAPLFTKEEIDLAWKKLANLDMDGEFVLRNEANSVYLESVRDEYKKAMDQKVSIAKKMGGVPAPQAPDEKAPQAEDLDDAADKAFEDDIPDALALKQEKDKDGLF